MARRIDNATEVAVADTDIQMPAAQERCRARRQPLLPTALTEQDRTDALTTQVKDQPAAAILEAQHFVHRR